jgi:hypothetical protein
MSASPRSRPNLRTAANRRGVPKAASRGAKMTGRQARHEAPTAIGCPQCSLRGDGCDGATRLTAPSPLISRANSMPASRTRSTSRSRPSAAISAVPHPLNRPHGAADSARPRRRGDRIVGRFAAIAHGRCWHQATDCRESPIRSLSDAQRTCRELVGRVDPTLLTRLGHCGLYLDATRSMPLASTTATASGPARNRSATAYNLIRIPKILAATG